MPVAGTPVKYQATKELARSFADALSPTLPTGVMPAFVTRDKGTRSDLIVGFPDGSWHAVPDVLNTDLVP